MNDLYNEILEHTLNYVSDVSCGYPRVCKRFNAFFQKIKDQRIKNEKKCFEQFSPFIVFTNYSKKKIFEKACKLNDKRVIEYLITKGANNWEWGMSRAAQGGHKDLVNFFIEKGAKNWECVVLHKVVINNWLTSSF